jgi:hypothetical protein
MNKHVQSFFIRVLLAVAMLLIIKGFFFPTSKNTIDIPSTTQPANYY